MGTMTTLLTLLLSLTSLLTATAALPLSTSSRWIVDENGQRVKLACVNWVAHLDPVVAEGLSKQPLDSISKRITSLGFNCVRLTWPLYLATNDSLAAVTVRQSFQSLGLQESIAGVQSNNPSLIDLPLLKAFQEVVTNLGNNNVMVILDNHVSKPGWCCSNNDDNGFFGDKYFNPDLWIKGLTQMAILFKGVSNVVGMSLRNELRGPKQNVEDWYKYMPRGAEAVHSANPDVLVILSGLYFDTDLSFVNNRPVKLTFPGKLVYELHWYGFSDGQAWADGNANQVCGRVSSEVKRKAGYLLDKGFPLFVSEFGIDQRGTNVNDNRYLNCFLAAAAQLDVEYALWTLVGSYYLRSGVLGMNEYYGLLNWNWGEIRNSSLLQRLSVLQSPFQGPGLSEVRKHKIILHPSTGLCLLKVGFMGPLKLGPCSQSGAWSYSSRKVLALKGTYFCIQADQLGKPAAVGIICTDTHSQWDTISDSKLHLQSKTPDGAEVCLDVDSSNTIVTNSCKCLSKDKACDPGSQWFSLVDSTLTSKSTSPILQVNSVLDMLGMNVS
ncbi:hypothetical protein ACLB2K_039510 [Fragaria x ananassa]